MSYIRDRAIILKAEPFREHDRWIVMFGEQHGLLEAVARGAMRGDAKQAGHLLPMSEVEVMIAKGTAFDKLAVSTVVHPYSGIRRRLGSLAILGAFFDLFVQLQRPGIVDSDLYALLKDLLIVTNGFSEEPSRERAKLLFSATLIKLLDRTGFSPQLIRCGLCHGELGEGDHRQLPQDGSIVHEDCYRSVRATQPNAPVIQQNILSLTRFLRDETLEKSLMITATSQTFYAVSSLIFQFLRQTPLMKEPHGMLTITTLIR